MDLGFLKSQNRELRKMNDGKVGAPFEYSHTYIQFLAFLKIGFKISYRTVQGIVRRLSVTSGSKKCILHISEEGF